MNSTYQQLEHLFAPVYDKSSKVLILGTFPSVKSRENAFFYGHPQNRFWKIMAKLTGSHLPQTIEEKKHLLLQNNIAIWDVIASCEIVGSSDSSIRNVVPADIGRILREASIQKVYANGGKAYQLYQKYLLPVTKREIIALPSSSPANAAFNMERLLGQWQQVAEVIKEGNSNDIF